MDRNIELCKKIHKKIIIGFLFFFKKAICSQSDRL